MFDLSIEITTYNRKAVLRELLERLRTQSVPASRFEVVLSDDGSSDGLQDMVRQLSAMLPYTLRLLQHEHSGPGRAHNAGIRACEADVVLMLAADILPTAALVEQHLRSHRENPGAHVVVAGRLTQSPALPDTVFQRAANAEVERIFLSRADQIEHGGFLVSNLSFKKDFMLRHGMFREWPPASGEDLELGYRLKKAGMQVIENDRALGFHHHEETLASVARRAYMTGYNSHHFSAEVDEAWVRRRFGHPEPGMDFAQRARVRLRDGMRNVLINRATTAMMMIPLIRMAEKVAFLAPLTPLMHRKIAAYYFKRGLGDYRAARPYLAPDITP